MYTSIFPFSLLVHAPGRDRRRMVGKAILTIPKSLEHSSSSASTASACLPEHYDDGRFSVIDDIWRFWQHYFKQQQECMNENNHSNQWWFFKSMMVWVHCDHMSHKNLWFSYCISGLRLFFLESLKCTICLFVWPTQEFTSWSSQKGQNLCFFSTEKIL